MSREIPLFQVDAFVTSQPFSGNPAAVCPLTEWLPDGLLQGIALQNNLSETAYLVPSATEGVFDLRWFTPACEVDLCGHATLASAHVVFEYLRPSLSKAWFRTRGGTLTVTRGAGDLMSMDFPALAARPVSATDELVGALGAGWPSEVLAGMDTMAVFPSVAQVRDMAPDMVALSRLETRGVIATAAGGDGDFVSRFFAPAAGIDEDPVTGSAHCLLAPYWARKLGRDTLDARQVSRRGGHLHCRVDGDRVLLAGKVRPFLTGAIRV